MQGVRGGEVKNVQNMPHENLKKIIAKMIKKEL